LYQKVRRCEKEIVLLSNQVQQLQEENKSLKEGMSQNSQPNLGFGGPSREYMQFIQ